MKDRGGLVKLLALCEGTLGQLRLGSKSVAQWKAEFSLVFAVGFMVVVWALEEYRALGMFISLLVLEDSC